MVKIQIPVSKMKQFLELISCEGGTDEGNKQDKVIKEFVIFAMDNSIESYATDKIGKLFANVKMTVTVLEPGQFTIGDVDNFEKYLGVFEGKDMLMISQESGTIKMARNSPAKLMKFSTVSIDNIETFNVAKTIHTNWKMSETDIGTEKTKLTNVITVKAEDLAQVVNDSRIVGEQHYPFVVMKNEHGQLVLKVEVGSLQTSMAVIKSIIPAVINSVELNNKYAYGFDNVFTTLRGDVKLFTAPNMPMWVVKSESDYKVRYMLTPVTD